MKYDGKDASKCAMRGLRGNALKYSLTKSDRTGIIGIMVQNSTKTQPETASVRMHPVLRRICRHEKEDCRRTRPAFCSPAVSLPVKGNRRGQTSPERAGGMIPFSLPRPEPARLRLRLLPRQIRTAPRRLFRKQTPGQARRPEPLPPPPKRIPKRSRHISGFPQGSLPI